MVEDLVERLRRRLAELAALQTQGSLVEKLARKAVERAGRIAETYRELARLGGVILDKLESEGLLRTLRRADWSFTSIGLDGSRQLVRGPLGRHYVFASVAAVKIWPNASRVELSYPAVDIVELVDPTGALAEEAAEYAMLLLETASLAALDCSNGEVVVLDGPIVDPPGELRAEALKLAASQLLSERSIGENPLSYHQARGTIVASKTCTVVGVVKRISSTNLLALLARKLGVRIPEAATDEDVAAAIASRLSEGSHYAIGPIDACSVLPETLAAGYCSRGKRLFYVYTFSPYTLKPLRIEVASENGSRALGEVERVLATIPPGRSLPLPVLLAHEKSRIDRKLAMLLYREVLSKSASLLADKQAARLEALAITWGRGD